MAKFLRSNIIHAAANRLAASKTRSGFVDFLVLKRALKRIGGDTVPFSAKDEHFTGAIHELAGVGALEGVGKVPGCDLPPFFKVFGTSQQVSEKMVTNGSADTLSGPAWQPVVRLEGQRPRRGGLQRGHEAHLERLLLKNNGEKPSLVDAAIWFFRNTNLESKRIALDGSGKALGEALERGFTADLGLNNEEIRLLFNTGSNQIDSTPASELIQPAPASPETFLPNGIGDQVEDAELARVKSAFENAAHSDEVQLQIDASVVLRFTSSLLAKRFVVLTGLAGSGKTKLAQAFAHWLSEVDGDTPSHAVVPVGADWTGNENILGYPDGLNAEQYVSRQALQLILAAESNPDVPHFLILDEMNLSHVERYFADTLSAIESGEKIPLYEGAPRKAGEQDIPGLLALPPNLFIIGTVNVDETTYMFSPKVLDRANVIEFRMERTELKSFLATPAKPDLEKLDGVGADFAKTFVTAAASTVEVPASIKVRYESKMILFFDILREHDAEFGFRVGHEAARFVHFYQKLGGFADGADWFDEAFDAVIVQKFLPKLHGSRSKLEGLLWALAWVCAADRAGKPDEDFLKECQAAGKAQDEGKFSPETLANKKPRYPMSFDKVMRMWRKLVRDQFVTFAEA
jgi:energy-coupling factor transporter ATP-binding protein EcfA2